MRNLPLVAVSAAALCLACGNDGGDASRASGSGGSAGALGTDLGGAASGATTGGSGGTLTNSASGGVTAAGGALATGGTGGGPSVSGGTTASDSGGTESAAGASSSSSGGAGLAGGTPGSSAGGAASVGGTVSGGTASSSGGAMGSTGGSALTGGSEGRGTGGHESSGGAPGAGGAQATGGVGGVAGAAGALPTGGASGSPGWCSLPTSSSAEATQDYYQVFKDTVVTADGAQGYLRIWKPDSGTVTGSTVSEGMGYGLLLAVYHDDQATFDALWRYTALYLNENGLMDWEIDPDGAVIGTGAASDGDEDIAFALVMAARKWGGRGTLDEDYLTLGVRMIDAMSSHEVDLERGSMWLPGDAWGSRDITNLSYFAPAYFRVFGEVTGNVAEWNAVIEGTYTILERTLNDALGNANNGLVPAWSDSQGNLVSAFDGAPTHFQNDSTRTPFRVGQDWCWFGEPRAKAYLDKIAAFYAGVGVSNIENGYDLDGTPRPENDSTEQSASFVGPAGVAFMSAAEWQPELDEAWALVATGGLLSGTTYYQTSWTALSLLMMSGAMVVYP